MNIESTTLLGLDLGTTHCKAGLFALDGRGLYIASLDNPAQRGLQGYSYYVPEAMWRNVEALLAGMEGWRRAQDGRWHKKRRRC